MKEIWKDIKGYEGLYQVSNLGNIKRKERIVECKNNRYFKIEEKKLKHFNNGKGYLVVTLNNKEKKKNHYIHRLVAEHFLSNYDEKKVVNHLDFNTKNNCIENLECISQKENIYYSKNNGRYENAKKITSQKNIKRGKEKIKKHEKEIISLYTNGVSIDFIAKKFHLKYENVSNLINKKVKKLILCIETNERFNNIKEANLKYKVTTISDAISGRQKTSANLHWKKIYEII